MKNLFRKKSDTTKLPMTGKVKRGFIAYCAIIMVLAITCMCSITAFAAGNDPLSVVNNLSDFMFGLIRAIGLILLGFGIDLNLAQHAAFRIHGRLPKLLGIHFTKTFVTLN